MKIQVSTISLSSVSFQCLPLAKPNQHQWGRDLIDTACRGQREEGKREKDGGAHKYSQHTHHNWGKNWRLGKNADLPTRRLIGRANMITTVLQSSPFGAGTIHVLWLALTNWLNSYNNLWSSTHNHQVKLKYSTWSCFWSSYIKRQKHLIRADKMLIEEGKTGVECGEQNLKFQTLHLLEVWAWVT